MGQHERAIGPDALPPPREASVGVSRFQLDYASWYARIAGSNGQPAPVGMGAGQVSCPTR